MQVFKYPLEIVGEQTIKLPRSYKTLSVVSQRNNLVLYCLVDEEETDTCERVIHIHGTGHPFTLPNPAIFLGTVATFDANLVWHIWISF